MLADLLSYQHSLTRQALAAPLLFTCFLIATGECWALAHIPVLAQPPLLWSCHLGAGGFTLEFDERRRCEDLQKKPRQALVPGSWGWSTDQSTWSKPVRDPQGNHV